MARAGFWAIGGYQISFRSDGNWYADEEVIGNPRIALLFSRHLRRDAEQGWMIDLGIDRQRVRVEDAPLVVRTVSGDLKRGLRIRTNDDVEEPLDCATLEVGAADVLYCEVDRGARGRLRARFLRPAYYELARWIEDVDGAPALRCGQAVHRIARAPA